MKKNKNKIKIGSWIMSYNPAAAKLMSSLGFDWLCIDLENSTTPPVVLINPEIIGSSASVEVYEEGCLNCKNCGHSKCG